MSRRSLMSDSLKWELAHDLGVADVVSTEGWGGVSARNCGNLVKLAVMRAEEALARNYAQRRGLEARGYRAAPAETGGGTFSPNVPYWALERGPGSEELRR